MTLTRCTNAAKESQVVLMRKQEFVNVDSVAISCRNAQYSMNEASLIKNVIQKWTVWSSLTTR